jgi:hypothetical protein
MASNFVKSFTKVRRRKISRREVQINRMQIASGHPDGRALGDELVGVDSATPC